MLLTVEEIDNIAEVTGEREGAHTFAVALETKLIEKLCAGVEMPQAFSLVDDELVYTADQLRTAVAAARVKALEDAATEAERMTMYPGGRQEAPAHDTVWHAARAIRALRGEA